MEDYVVYKNAAFALKDHLKWLWENTEQKLEYLKGDVQTFDYNDKSGGALEKSVLNSVGKILKQTEIESREFIYIDNLFADIFEEYFKAVSDYKKIQNANELNYNDLFDSAYTLIAFVRALLKKVDGFIELFYGPVSAPDGVRIKDDRVEITLQSVKELFGQKQAEKQKDYKKLLLLRVFGYPALMTAIVSLFVVIVMGVIAVSQASARVQEIAYLKQESLETYNAALKEIVKNVSDGLYANFLFRLALKLIPVGFISALIYAVIGNAVFKKLKEMQIDQASFKYYLSWFYIDLGLSMFKHNYEQHKILIIEAAEEGYVDALLRLGWLYEKGYFEKSKIRKASVENLNNAMRCYKQAFPNKKAVNRYNAIEQKLTGKK